MANPLIYDPSPEYQAKLETAAIALEALDPFKKMGSRCFAAHNRMGNASSVIFTLFQANPESGKRQLLLQLRPSTEVWPNHWGVPASALNAYENKEEVLDRKVQELGCELALAVPLYGADWYMDPDRNPFVDPVACERGSYYHYPYYVEVKGKPTVGQRGYEWWDEDALPDESTWVVHHIRGCAFRAIKYLQNREKVDAAIATLRQVWG